VAEVLQGTKVVAPAFDDNLLGFDGAFDYQATDKTSAVLSLSRNFGSSALGQSTKSSQYGLQITSNPTPQFSLSAKATYRLTDNGPAVFAATPAGAAAAERQDKGWENSLGATYTFTKWLTLVANYTFRNNRSTYAQSTNPSTQTVPDYNNNVFSLTLGLQY
jgi:predicted porin